VPKGAKQAVLPPAKTGDIVGVVWRDFKPGGGVAGKVESQEVGLPGVRIQLRSSSGKAVQSATSASDGTFDFKNVPTGSYKAAIAASTFNKPWGGYSWLGPTLITWSLLIAYIWIWAGFAMVVIGRASRRCRATCSRRRAPTAPPNADVPPRHRAAARTGAQRRVHHDDHQRPQGLRHRPCTRAGVDPVERERDRARNVAHIVRRQNDFGTGSAIAVFLFLLVIPVLALNIRRFKREV